MDNDKRGPGRPAKDNIRRHYSLSRSVTEALRVAAADQRRDVSPQLEIIAEEWLRANGYAHLLDQADAAA